MGQIMWFQLLIGGGAIGALSKKVISFGVKVKTCSICQRAKSLGKDPKPHKCYKNHGGSAKSMEASIGVDIATGTGVKTFKLMKENVKPK